MLCPSCGALSPDVWGYSSLSNGYFLEHPIRKYLHNACKLLVHYIIKSLTKYLSVCIYYVFCYRDLKIEMEYRNPLHVFLASPSFKCLDLLSVLNINLLFMSDEAGTSCFIPPHINYAHVS